MRFTDKDWITTGLVAALIIVYGVYLAADGTWLAQNARDMGHRRAGGCLPESARRRPDRVLARWPAIVAAFATLGLGVVVMITWNEVVLAAFILASVALMNAALAVHAHVQVAPVGHRRATGVIR